MQHNKQLGNQFERKVAQHLSKLGYWVHLLKDNANGQPADMIAAKGNEPMLVDAKYCTNGEFHTRRIEENQWLAMEKWRQCSNTDCGFVLGFPDGVMLLVWAQYFKRNTHYSRQELEQMGDKL